VDLPAILIVLAAGLAMGFINNVAGGAGALGLLAFEHACHLPLDQANPSTRLAAVAIGTFAWLGYLRAGRKVPARAWLQGAVALPGAVLGSELALRLPDLAFRSYLALVMVLLLWQQLRPRLPTAQPRSPWFAAAGCLLIGLHMGFVQVGTGLVATLVLAAAYDRDLVEVNVAKSVVVIFTSLASALTFTVSGTIVWAPACCLAIAAAIGSYAASHWSVRRGSAAIRRVVLVIAVITLVDQLWHIALSLRAP
jgi:uncharacterized protein